MFRDKDEELRRLEEALWEEEEEEEDEEEEYEEEYDDDCDEDAYDDEDDDYASFVSDATESEEDGPFRNGTQRYRAYNSDNVDVDLDEYSEQIRQEPKSGSCLLMLLLLLLCGILVMLILFILRFQGIL